MQRQLSDTTGSYYYEGRILSPAMPSFTHHAVDLQLEAKRPRDVAQLDDVWEVERAAGLDGGVARTDHLRKHDFIAVTHQ